MREDEDVLRDLDRGRSLEDIEGVRWSSPGPDATRLIAEVHRLRTVPVSELTAEDLRLLVGQQVSLETVMPLALEHLIEDPLTEGDMYPGDLLAAALKVPATFWAHHPELAHPLRDLVSGIANRAPSEIETLAGEFLAQSR